VAAAVLALAAAVLGLAAVVLGLAAVVLGLAVAAVPGPAPDEATSVAPA
jgi:hypothetical protein